MRAIEDVNTAINRGDGAELPTSKESGGTYHAEYGVQNQRYVPIGPLTLL